MDRNTVIGFSLLALLLIGYISYNQYSQKEYLEQKKADSIARAKTYPKPEAPATADIAATATPAADTLADSAATAGMPAAFRGQAETVKLENEEVAIEFSTKGAHPVSALLKEYQTYDDKPLYLFDSEENNKLSAVLPIRNGAVATDDLYFTPSTRTESNGDQTIDFAADLGDGKEVHMIYTLPKEGYMMHTNIRLTGMPAEVLALNWQTQSLHTERDLGTERQNSQVYYRLTNKDNDYHTINNQADIDLDETPVEWVGFKMHFFNSTLIAEGKGFSQADIQSTTEIPDSSIVAQNTTKFTVPLDNTAEQSVNLSWYIGPNDYQILNSYHIGMEEMVPLGYGIMAFVKYVNKLLIIPVFNFFSKFISNYGIVIMLLTIVIRLLLSFFTYKSYLSAAKMRVLKPELDELREKCGDDKQKFGMEQMKLYRTAGVNPLGGCLPTLFQLPILIAMYYFFPSSIELRQESFLWAKDLSTYDSIVSWSTHIPILSSVYGNHISLFTLLMTISSLFLALYNRNMTAQDPNNPMLKWMPFVFPIILMGVFNKMAAALTFYYFFSNVISIAQQFIIQKYVINEEAIHRKMKENRNKPATPSKWQQRLEEMQKMQAERTKQKGPKK